MHKVLRKRFAVTRVKYPLIQDDSVGGDSQLIINQGITCRVYTLVEVEIAVLQKTLRIISFRLKTEAETTLEVRESCCQHDNANRSRMHLVSVARYRVLPISFFICKFSDL